MAEKNKEKRGASPESIDEAIEVLTQVARHDQALVRDVVNDKKQKINHLVGTPHRVRDSIDHFKDEAIEESSELAERAADSLKANPWPFFFGFLGTLGLFGYFYYRTETKNKANVSAHSKSNGEARGSH